MSNVLTFITLTKTESNESIQNMKRNEAKRQERSKRNKVVKNGFDLRSLKGIFGGSCVKIIEFLAFRLFETLPGYRAFSHSLLKNFALQHRHRKPGDRVDHVSRDLLHVIVRASCSLRKIYRFCLHYTTNNTVVYTE